MALGRRGTRTGSMFIAATDLPKSGGHPFYAALNRLLSEANFDRIVEEMCAEAYAARKGRPSIPPGVYFRMYFVGYFESIDSQRGIAWRCNDSLSIREFLGLALDERTPDHSSLTVIRQRLSSEIHEAVFALVLGIAQENGLLGGKTLGVDATTLEANAAMKSIIRKDTSEDWRAYLRRLAQEVGIENPTEEELRRFDKKRGSKKKTSNDDWTSPTDPDSRIAKMKDGRTHLAYKAEHAVDLESQIIVAATVQPANRSDAESLRVTVESAKEMLAIIEHETTTEEIVADKGYHSISALTFCAAEGLRTYIPPKKQRGRRRWTDKPEEAKKAVTANDRRTRGDRGRLLQRQRSERVERSFAHLCETGGARRSWLRGFVDVGKRYLATVAAHNLGRILLALIGVGKPKSLQGGLEATAKAIWEGATAIAALIATWLSLWGKLIRRACRPSRRPVVTDLLAEMAFSTGC
jgi:transposase